jgi:hypothetical protein
MTNNLPILALASILARAGGCEEPRNAPLCEWSYEMVGDSEENAHLYDDQDQEVDRIAIDASTRCDDVEVTVTHRDTSAELLEPDASCVRTSSGEGTAVITFTYSVSCECDAPWDWLATNKAPPAKFPIQIKPVPGCGGG